MVGAGSRQSRDVSLRFVLTGREDTSCAVIPYLHSDWLAQHKFTHTTMRMTMTDAEMLIRAQTRSGISLTVEQSTSLIVTADVDKPDDRLSYYQKILDHCARWMPRHSLRPSDGLLEHARILARFIPITTQEEKIASAKKIRANFLQMGALALIENPEPAAPSCGRTQTATAGTGRTGHRPRSLTSSNTMGIVIGD